MSDVKSLKETIAKDIFKIAKIGKVDPSILGWWQYHELGGKHGAHIPGVGGWTLIREEYFPKRVPRRLYIDFETSPNIAKIWGKYEQNSVGDFIQERMIICVAWKWAGEHTVHSMSIPDFYGYKKYVDKNFVRKLDNRKLILKIHELVSEADIIIAQNGDQFDIKMMNAEFIEYGLTPPPPYKTVDTLKVARSKFKFNSNKLDDLGERLGLGRKIHTGGATLWEGCLRGEKKSWDKMVEYNKQDIVLLEGIYHKLGPWMTTHPNMNSFDGINGCPVCKCTKLDAKGFSINKSGKSQQYQCTRCGKWSLGKSKTMVSLK